jgi:hypothetical protein
MTTRLVPVLVVLLALALVAAPATADPATVTIDAPSSAQHGETVTVSLNVTNTGENATGYLVNVSLPEGWTVANHADDGGRWQADDTEWVFLSIDPGDSRQPALDLTVPSDTADGTADFTASVTDGKSVRDIAIADVTVESGDSGSGSDGSDGGSDDGSSDGGSDSGPDSTDTDDSNEPTTGSNSTPTDDSTAGTGDTTSAGETPARTLTDEPTGTSAPTDPAEQSEGSTETGTGTDSTGLRTTEGLAIGALLLLAVGVGVVTVRRRGLTEMTSTPAANDGSAASESSTDGDADSGTADAQVPADAGTDRSALTTAFETAGVDVLDVRETPNGYEVEYWTAATDEDSAREEVSSLVGSYLTAIESGATPQRLDATLIRNGEPFGTWHIREPWIHQLTDGEMSKEALEKLVFRTVTRPD